MSWFNDIVNAIGGIVAPVVNPISNIITGGGGGGGSPSVVSYPTSSPGGGTTVGGQANFNPIQIISSGINNTGNFLGSIPGTVFNSVAAPIITTTAPIVGNTIRAVQSGMSSPAFQSAMIVAPTMAAAMPIAAPIIMTGSSLISGAKNFFAPAPTQIPREAPSQFAPPSTLKSSNISSEGMTVFVPYGDKASTQIDNAKVIYGKDAGDVGIYQVPRSVYENSGFHRIYGIVTSSGGPGALQSGMFSTKPQTPVVFTQESGGTKFSPAANPTAAAQVLANPSAYSDVGAEAYGGSVLPLDNRVLTPTAQMGRYPVESGNLANLVNPTGVNQLKPTWETIPWSMDWNAPNIQRVDLSGSLHQPSIQDLESVGMNTNISTQMLSGGNKVAGLPTTISSLPESPEVVSAPVLVPSKFGQWAMQQNIPILSGALTETSDFLFSGTNPIAAVAKQASSLITGEDVFSRYNMVTKTGVPVSGESIVTKGTPTTSVRDLGNGAYEITTLTPVTTSTNVMTPNVVTMTPAEGGFEHGSEQAGLAFNSWLPGWAKSEYKSTGSIIDYPASFVSEGWKAVRSDPLTALMNVGIGIGLAAGGEAVAGLAAGTTAATGLAAAAPGAGLLTRGAAWAAPLMQSWATRVAPTMLVGLYGADVAQRSTNFKVPGWDFSKVSADLSPASAGRFGAIFGKEAGPMLLGGLGFSNRAVIGERARGMYDSGRGTISDIRSNPPSLNQVRNVISDSLFSLRQRGAGIERVGPRSGLSYVEDVVPRPSPTSGGGARPTSTSGGGHPAPTRISGLLETNIPSMQPRSVGRSTLPTTATTGRLPSIRQVGVEGQGQWGGLSMDLPPTVTDLVPVRFERNVVASAYDIGRTNAVYDISSNIPSIKIQTNRDIINTGMLGKLDVVQRSSGMTIDAGEYARATGRDVLPSSGASAGTIDVYRTQVVRDAYPSGRVYENIIGRKGMIDIPGTDISSLISSRGIVSGQGPVLRTEMANADVILDTAIPRVPSSSNLSPVDLPRAVTDLTSGFGTINVMSELPTAATTNIVTATSRFVRAPPSENIETLFGNYAIQNAPSGAKLGVTLPGSKGGGSFGFGDSSALMIRDGAYVGVPLKPRGPQPSTLFNTLPEHGAFGSEVISTFEGKPLKPVTNEGYSLDINTDISTSLYGREASAFEMAAAQLREISGVENVMNTGLSTRVSGGITPLSKTFGKSKISPKGGKAPEVGSGDLKLLTEGVSSSTAKATADTVGKVVENLFKKAEQASRQATGQASVPSSMPKPATDSGISSGLENFLSPWGRKSSLLEEETVYYRENVPSMSRPSASKGPKSETLSAELQLGGQGKTVKQMMEQAQESLKKIRFGSLSGQMGKSGSLTGSIVSSLQDVGIIQNQLRDATNRQDTFLSTSSMLGQISSSVQATDQTQRHRTILDEMTTSLQERAPVSTQERIQDIVPKQEQRTDIITTPRTTETVKTDTKQTTDTDIITRIIPEITIIKIPDIVIPPRGGGGIGGGGGSGESPRKYYKRHTQLYEYPWNPWAAAQVTMRALRVGSNITGKNLLNSIPSSLQTLKSESLSSLSMPKSLAMPKSEKMPSTEKVPTTSLNIPRTNVVSKSGKVPKSGGVPNSLPKSKAKPKSEKNKNNKK